MFDIVSTEINTNYTSVYMGRRHKTIHQNQDNNKTKHTDTLLPKIKLTKRIKSLTRHKIILNKENINSIRA